MRFRSRRHALMAAAAVGAVLIPLPSWPTLAGGDNAIVLAGQTIAEDYYAFAGRVIVEGTVEGDLIAATQELVITGEVTGDVLAVVTNTARIGGVVGGSVRVAARTLRADGTVGDDLTYAAVESSVAGEVGRDLLATAGTMDMAGAVGRDLRGQIWRLGIDGDVGQDVDVTTQSLEVGPGAVVGGELAYKADDEGTVSAGAEVGGQLIRQRPRVPIQLRAVQRIVSIVSLLAFLATGLVLFWLLRRTLPRAVAAVERRPLQSALVGAAAVVGAPFAMIALAFTLVGLPLALMLLALWLAALFVGPIPAVTAAVDTIARGRLGLIGAFVVGALAWRGSLWLVPFVGVVIFLIALAWGTGGWVMGAWQARSDEPSVDLPTLAAPPRPGPEPPEDWEPPLAPEAASPPGPVAGEAPTEGEPQPPT